MQGFVAKQIQCFFYGIQNVYHSDIPLYDIRLKAMMFVACDAIIKELP